jgi:phosphate transport system permease protein
VIAGFIISILFCILCYLFTVGVKGLNWHVLTTMTQPAGMDGGLLNAMVGSLILSFVALLIGGPIGVFIGLYLGEYNLKGRLASLLRYVIDILLGAPSIIFGIFIYSLYVVHVGHFSGWAGSLALAMLVVPITAKTTESIYTLVPSLLKESILALGAPRWRLCSFVIARVIRGSVLTALLLSLSRIIGEAAPLLFTALSNQFWNLDMDRPMSNLPMLIYNYAMSPYADWQQLAWTAALLITMLVLTINLICRFLIKDTIKE